MGHPEPLLKLDFAGYLEWESRQPDKHEYYAGEIFAMTGARRAHVTVAGNLFAAFKAHLRGIPCRAYLSSMKLRIAEVDASFYPDVMVTCDSRDHAADLYLENPTLIIEVLSEGTAAFDRGEKFAAYRRLASLREYAIVDIGARRVECFRRDSTGHWVLYESQGDSSCEFESIDLTLPLSSVFEGVETPDDAAADRG